MSGETPFALRASRLIPLAALAFIIASFIAGVLDLLFALPYYQMLIAAAVLSAIIVIAAVRKPSPVVIAVCVGVLVSVSIYWVRPTSRGLFLQDLYSIKPGTTIAQVRHKMKHYRKRVEARTDPLYWPGNEGEADYCITYSHSRLSEYNADFGAVVFRRGKVVYTTFSPD